LRTAGSTWLIGLMAVLMVHSGIWICRSAVAGLGCVWRRRRGCAFGNAGRQLSGYRIRKIGCHDRVNSCYGERQVRAVNCDRWAVIFGFLPTGRARIRTRGG
jgi:hypothetical protein